MIESYPNCKSCKLGIELGGVAGTHEVENINLYCPMCKNSNNWIYHGEHDSLSGDALECNYCNKYIIYTNGKDTIWKDEIYFDKDYCLIRDMESLKSYFSIGDKLVYIFPNLIDFSESKDILNKLKMVAVFK